MARGVDLSRASGPPCTSLLQDVVYKDVIEPLESVSVSLVPTEKKDVRGYGMLGVGGREHAREAGSRRGAGVRCSSGWWWLRLA